MRIDIHRLDFKALFDTSFAVIFSVFVNVFGIDIGIGMRIDVFGLIAVIMAFASFFSGILSGQIMTLKSR